jgi:magnesium-transporting ATPase (P-type)
MVRYSSNGSDAGSSDAHPNKSEPQLQVSVHHLPPDERPDVLFTPRRASRKEKDDEDEDEDLDALIEELNSLDPEDKLEDDVETVLGARNVPEELLQTDTCVGLIEPEVIARRKKYGLNQMREEKENLLLKFLGYFVGPIQFVMEVCSDRHVRFGIPGADILCYRLLPFLLQVWKIGSTLASFVVCSSSTPASASSKNSKPLPQWRN